MNTYYSGRSSRPAGLFSFGLLDGPHACVILTCEKLRRDFGLSRFATAFMNNPV
jgi:hypothetical protein